MFKAQPYVAFCEDFSKDGKRLTKYVTLDQHEWSTLQKSIARIQNSLNYDVIYAEDSDTWHLQQITKSESADAKLRLVPRMCRQTFLLQLYVYLVTSMIKKTRKDTCEACQKGIDLPYWHQSDGFACAADWYTTVTTRLDDAKQAIDIEHAVSVVNAAMGWQMSSKDYTVNDDLLRDVTVNHEVLPTCDECRSLLPIYWRLYEELL